MEKILNNKKIKRLAMPIIIAVILAGFMFPALSRSTFAADSKGVIDGGLVGEIVTPIEDGKSTLVNDKGEISEDLPVYMQKSGEVQADGKVLYTLLGDSLNQWDIETQIDMYISTSPELFSYVTYDGRRAVKCVTADVNSRALIFDFGFKTSTQYYISYTGIIPTTSGSTYTQYFIVDYTDGTRSEMPLWSADWDKMTLVTPVGKTVKGIRITLGSSIVTYFDLDSFIITEGTETHDYEPAARVPAFYKENTVTGLTSYGETLSEVAIPSYIPYYDAAITTIGRKAFEGAENLEKVTLPSTVKIIQDNAFASSTVETINLPNSITKIGNRAFYDCSALTLSALPSSLKSVGSLAFYNVTFGATLTLPQALETIGSRAFVSGGYTSVIVGKNVKSMAATPFYVADNITVLGENTHYKMSNGALMEIAGAKIIDCEKSVTGDVVFIGVKTVGNSALTNAGYTSVRFANTLETVEANGLSYMPALENIIFPDTLKTLAEDAIIDNVALESVQFNNFVELTAGNFEDCDGLQFIYVPQADYTKYTNSEAWAAYSPLLSGKAADTVTITFETNGGEEIAAIEFEKGSVLADLPDAEKDGAEFLGWFYDKKFKTEAVDGDLINKDITLYAKYSDDTSIWQDIGNGFQEIGNWFTGENSEFKIGGTAAALLIIVLAAILIFRKK